MLVMPPPVLEMLEASLHEEVAERPRDAGDGGGDARRRIRADDRTEFGKWCDSVSGNRRGSRARAAEGA